MHNKKKSSYNVATYFWPIKEKYPWEFWISRAKFKTGTQIWKLGSNFKITGHASYSLTVILKTNKANMM